jgi:hypothetical protein
MKRALVLALATCFFSLSAVAAPKDSTYDGWISDSKCAAKGGSEAHAACAKKCIEGGEKPVLVSDKDGKVIGIANPDAVISHAGQHVQVTGTLKDGALQVDKVAALKQ